MRPLKNVNAFPGVQLSEHKQPELEEKNSNSTGHLCINCILSTDEEEQSASFENENMSKERN